MAGSMETSVGMRRRVCGFEKLYCNVKAADELLIGVKLP